MSFPAHQSPITAIEPVPAFRRLGILYRNHFVQLILELVFKA